MPLCPINNYCKVRDLVWVTLPWCLQKWQYPASSAGTTGEKQSLDSKEISRWKERTTQIPLSTGQLCIPPAWKECQSPATHPASPPEMSRMAPAHSQGQENTQLLGMHEESRHVRRTESLTRCYRHLGFSALQRIKPVSIPRASGAGFDLRIALPNF